MRIRFLTKQGRLNALAAAAAAADHHLAAAIKHPNLKVLTHSSLPLNVRSVTEGAAVKKVNFSL